MRTSLVRASVSAVRTRAFAHLAATTSVCCVSLLPALAAAASEASLSASGDVRRLATTVTTSDTNNHAMAAAAAGAGAGDATYKAVRVHEWGGPEKLVVEELPALTIEAPNEVIVHVHAAGVNPVESYIRSGAYAMKPELPWVPGNDAAGVVAAVGDAVTRVKVGDRVSVSKCLTGAYAEQTKAEESRVHVLPDSVSFPQGAGTGVPYATAYRALFQRCHAKPGDTVLVHGGSGAVGIAALQFCHSAGIRVIGTASTPGGLELMSKWADGVFDHTDHEGLAKFVDDFTGHAGADVIVEMLANVNLGRDLKMLAQGGCVGIVGSRGDVEITPRDLMAREASVVGVALAKATPKQWDEIHAAIYAGLRSGALSPVVGVAYPLAKAPEAHVEVIEHKQGSKGKIVLTTKHAEVA